MRIPSTTFSDTPLMGAKRFAILLHTNVNNAQLTDKAFRDFVRNSLPVVEYERPEIDIVFKHSRLAMAKKVFTRLTKQYPAISFGLSVFDEEGVIWLRKNMLTLENTIRVATDAQRIYTKVSRVQRTR